MPTSSRSYYPPNFLMLVVAFGTAASAVTEFVLPDGDELTREHRRAEFWQSTWENLHNKILSYERDENATESLSWDHSEIEDLLKLYSRSTGQRLLKAIEELKARTEELSEFFNTPVSRDSILAAERIAPQLPDTLPEGKIGFDEEGDVFLSFHRDDKSAFLTVEPDKLHLLLKGGGQPSRYFDNVPYHDFKIPKKVIEELSEI